MLGTQMHPATVLTFSTLRLKVSAGPKISTGTGFLYNIYKNDNEMLVIITNRNVIDGGVILETTVTTLVNPKTPEDSRMIKAPAYHNNVVVDLRSCPVFLHPSVDLCAIPIKPAMDIAIGSGAKIRHMILDESIFPDAEQQEMMSPCEPIIMIGYPAGLWDEVNNLPLVRRGVTGSNPCVPWNGRSEFVVDCTIFPASSGSPIFRIEDGVHGSRPGAGVRASLIGILHAGPVYQSAGQIKTTPIPTAASEQAPVINSMMSLGYAISFREIAALEDVARQMMP